MNARDLLGALALTTVGDSPADVLRDLVDTSRAVEPAEEAAAIVRDLARPDSTASDLVNVLRILLAERAALADEVARLHEVTREDVPGLLVRLDVTGDAFHDAPAAEVARILRTLDADRLTDDEGRLRDVNGNTVGAWTWTALPLGDDEAADEEEDDAEAERLISRTLHLVTATAEPRHLGWRNWDTWSVVSVLDNADPDTAEAAARAATVEDLRAAYAAVPDDMKAGADLDAVDWAEILETLTDDAEEEA